ncbi:hypothetical protein [[Mycoplasma] cavipharyngis]|uniref:hypothetical protein n=1 Tax=[Mycoplasma] cavipharyngis TaxID=92757 RepID=UPI0037039094
MKFKFWQWKSILQSTSWENLFFILVVSLILFNWIFNRFNWVQLLFLPLFFYFAYYFKLSWTQKVITICLAIIIAWLTSWIQLNVQKSIFNLLWPNNYLHQQAIELIDHNYGKSNGAILIKMLILNVNNFDHNLYFDFKNLSILHLVVASGIHFYLLSRIIKKIFFFSPKLGQLIANLVLIFYFVLIDFKYPIFRVLIDYLHQKKNHKYFYGGWSKTAVISMLFNLKIFLNYSFLLSMGIILIIRFISSCKISSKILVWLIINFLIWIYSLIIFLPFTKKIYYFAILNNFIFSAIILTFYLVLFFGWFIIYFVVIIEHLIGWLIKIIDFLTINKSWYYLEFWNSSFSQITMLWFLIMIYSIYLGSKKLINT